MAAGNTEFKVSHGLQVEGNANVSGNISVGGNLQVTGDLAFSGTVAGDYLPALDNTYALGNTTTRWILHGSSGNFSEAVSMAKTLGVTQTITANAVLPSANNRVLGSSTKLWNIVAGNTTSNTLNTTNQANVGTTLGVGTDLSVVGNTSVGNVFSVGGAAIKVTSNSTVNVEITHSLAFDQNLIYIDAVNNRIGIKNAAPSDQGVLTVDGNIVFGANATGIKLYASANTAGVTNASIFVSGNATVSSLVLNSMDVSNSTVKTLGGILITSTNSTATSNTLNVTQNAFLYKSGNVAHSGNFGIYNVSGTRVGP